MPGTMRKRGKDSYYLEVTVGTDFKGKPIRYNKTVHGTKKGAEKELAKFYAECEMGNMSKASNFTVFEMCEMVMDKKIRPNAKQNTVKGYESIVKQIGETIGSLKAANVKPVQVQEWINYLSREYINPRRRRKNKEKGLSPKSVKNAYSFLNMCYETMIEWEELSKKPTTHILLPKQENKEIDSLTFDEVMIFLEKIEKLSEEHQDFKVSALLALFCGLRRGEICGIDESSVNIEERCIKIKQTRYVGDNGVFEDTPKSGTSFREVFFPQEVQIEIKRLTTYHKKLKLRLGDLWKNSPALIKNVWGDSMYPNNLWDWLNNFLKQNDMRHFGFHSLRHTYTSMLSWMGKDLSEISKNLGHSKKTTTMNTYLHLFLDATEAKKKTANDLSEQIIKKLSAK